MPIQCVLFCCDKRPIQIKINAAAELPEAVGMWPLPAAVIVYVEDLKVFGECLELFTDRRKKGNQGLGDYLLGQGGKIPFIDAYYIDYGRLTDGIETLLQNAETASEKGIYLLGVNGEHFRKAWSSALTEDASLQHVSKGSGLEAVFKTLPGEAQLRKYFWGNSEAYHLVRQLILRAAQINNPVLVLGEPGTGKSVVARAIHDAEQQDKPIGQKDKPFIVVNCAEIPSGAFESVVFGYAAYDSHGAHVNAKAGRWEKAKDGTIFLDEIGELRLDHQAKVLHAMKEDVIWRVGDGASTDVHARVIAATNRDLYGMVKRGKFLDDLYYLLRQYMIRTPVLRDYSNDVEVIAQKLWREITHSSAALSKEIIDELCHHRWPGNVRELRSVLRSLNNYFGTSAPTREQLSAVFQQFGLAAGYDQYEPDVCEPALFQMECLQKICHVDDAIHACEQELKPLAAGLPLSAAAWESLARLSVEVQDLLCGRMYFGSQETYQAVAHVGESLRKLLELNKKDMPALSSFWDKTLKPDILLAVDLLFSELKNLRASKSPSAGMGPS